MGLTKAWMMEQESLEPMYEWIEDNFGDDAGEEGSEEWKAAVKAYEEYCDLEKKIEDEANLQQELEWFMYNRPQIGKFDIQVASIRELVEVDVSTETHFSLLVMLHGHIVAAVESYLASTFIREVTNSNDLIRKLIETDPVFSNMTFTLKDIYKEHENLQLTVANYLKDLIFHKLNKVKVMFKTVLGCDFGDITWLFKAVDIRHHCVHRAGLDKDGIKVNLSKESIIDLVEKSSQLVHSIENSLEFY